LFAIENVGLDMRRNILGELKQPSNESVDGYSRTAQRLSHLTYHFAKPEHWKSVIHGRRRHATSQAIHALFQFCFSALTGCFSSS